MKSNSIELLSLVTESLAEEESEPIETFPPEEFRYKGCFPSPECICALDPVAHNLRVLPPVLELLKVIPPSLVSLDVATSKGEYGSSVPIPTYPVDSVPP